MSPNGYGPEPLRQWLADNQNPSNNVLAFSQLVARKLLSDSDMSRAWPELERLKIPSMTLRALVENAIKNARQDAKKLTASEVEKQLNGVEELIRKLRRAILQSPLPANVGTFAELRHANMPPLNVVFGWHGMNPEADFAFHPVSVVDTLDFALQMLETHRNSEPARAVIRHVKHPEIRAFVVTLGWLIRKEWGSYLPGTVARIANAIYDPLEPLDKETVKDILKHSPEPFTRFKKGGSKATKQEP